MERKTKTVFQLDSPFTQVQWPEVQADQQDTILELLCSLLSPLGQHRANHVEPSKGKWSKKRKRKEAKLGEVALESSKPPVPAISSFVVVGLNSVTRQLESSSRASKPTQTAEVAADEKPEKSTTPDKSEEGTQDIPPPPTTFSAIFTTQTPLPSILHAHLPQLIATATATSTNSHPNLPATRLVQLPPTSEPRLCEALGLPRISIIGLLDGAPHSKALVDLVRECVGEIEIPWLEEVKKGRYLPVKINAIETFAPVVKEKEKKKG